MTRLYIIDDHCLIIDGLYSTFELESDDFEVVGGSLSVDEALEKIDPEKIDILILDLFIGHSDPVNNLTRIIEAFPGLPVVILSYESGLLWQVEMFRRGIRAYINKEEPKSEIIGKLRIVASGDVIITNEVANVLFAPDDDNITAGYSLDFYEIILALSCGLTVKEIAKKMKQSEPTIEKKLHVIRKFYNAKTNSELVYKAMIRIITN